MVFNAYSEQKETVSGITMVSCGHIFAKKGREIYRPNGREDWLLFYIASGSETFYFNDNTTKASAGSFVLYAPWEKQHHIYEDEGTAEFYYIHFKRAENATELSINTSTVYSLPLNRGVCDEFENIIEQTLQKKPLYERYCTYKLLCLLTEFEREILYSHHPEKANFERIARAVQYMNKNYFDDCSLEDYANMCAMSKYHFARIFEKTVGVTPIEYRNNIRMEHAKELIKEQRLAIEEISNKVGYSSASYFSSAFKQKYGISPKKYQKDNM